MKFKVGDKGFTANDHAYEIMYINTTLPEPYQVYAKVKGYAHLLAYSLEGKTHVGMMHDLLPPTRKLWVVIYQDDGDNYCGAVRTSLELAESADETYRNNEYITHGIHEIEIKS